MLQRLGHGHANASDRIRRDARGADDLVDLRQLIVTLIERKWTIALFVLAALAMATVYLARADRIYMASATVALNSREERVIDLAAVTSGLGRDYSTVMTELAVLTSRQLMRRVVERLDLTADPMFNPDLAEPGDREAGLLSQARALPGRGIAWLRTQMSGPGPNDAQSGAARTALPPEEVAVDILLGLVSVTSEEYIPVYNISVMSRSAEKSAAIANAIAEMYIVNQLETKFEGTAKATEWLSERVVDLKARLEAAERKVEDFLSSSKLVSEDGLQLRNKQLKDLRTRLAQIRADVDGAETRIAAAGPLAAAGDVLGAAALLGSAELDRLLVEHAAASPERQQVLAPRIGLMVERELARLAAQRTDGTEQVALLTRTVAQIETELARQADDLIELRQLQREAEASRSLYEHFLTRQSETAVQKGIQQADARVLSDAVVRSAPVAPKGTVTLMIALFLGAFGGASYVLITSTWDTRFRLPSEVTDATGLALLGTVPKTSARSRRKLFDQLMASGNSDMSESLRNIRTSIQLADVNHPPRVVMVTSSMPAEGKTSLSIGLAVVTAAARKKVLLIECDMRRNVYAQYFGKSDRPGLGAVLLGEATLAEAVGLDERSGVHVLRAERLSESPADLFSSQRFAALIAEAREAFDLVVLDTPPVLAVSDARIVANAADAVVFCIRWRKTTRSIANDALELLTMHDVPITGAVLTQVDRLRLAKYSYGGYGNYKAVYSYYRKA